MRSPDCSCTFVSQSRFHDGYLGEVAQASRVRLNEETLKAIATQTRTDHSYADTAGDLKKGYEALSLRLTVEKSD